MKVSAAILGAAVIKTAVAHTIFVQLNNNPVSYAIRDPSYDGPIQDVTSDDIACNGGPNPTTPSSAMITVAAGSTADLTWRHTLTSDATDVIDPSHKGPVMAYMKKVTNAVTDVGYGSGWFKIAEDTFTPSNSTWGVDRLIASGGIQTVTIPKCLAPGQYLLRGELIALHGASTQGGAQFYMECAQITVTAASGASVKTPSTVSLPGAYSATDPGILINLYYPTVTSYTAPGPDVFTC
ncbi:lytic polysaccharide monooxygenase [Viridothelium virens]|uniref:AA9 family lytic polysaccharide monooxygenase n=1 Tax=Viridothelium virens TaxID=1048519 RepID=A0A6A6H418_VIRVR|nr:lytic polysaccharide monooxygenase [Viridothelium virens]